MRLYALGDLHLSYKFNREALEALTPHPNDSLILCGDVGETVEHLSLAFRTARACFNHVIWVPGNHELYTLPSSKGDPNKKKRGEEKYHECVDVARTHGVLTPEDPFLRWEGEGGPCIIAPIFTLYDYTFRPDDVSQDKAIEWAKEQGIEATDEFLLHPDPYDSRPEWCDALIAKAEARLESAASGCLPLIIVNHWPLRHDLVHIPLVPRFSLWCGTKRTEDWHKRFKAKAVITGHLHVRRTDWIDGVRFEECSLGYPRQWNDARESGMDINDMLREVLPGPPVPPGSTAKTAWRRYG